MSVSFEHDGPGLDSENFSNANARAVLDALRLPCSVHGLVGQATIVDARRALMRARSTDLSRLTREQEITFGEPRVMANGAVDLHPIRSFSTGLSEDGLRDRIERIAALIERAASVGATVIRWG